MALDGITLSLVSKELSDVLIGSRVDKIHQPSKEELAISFRWNGGSAKVLMSASASAPRVHFTESPVDNPKSPPMFCMLMRKYLSGAPFEKKHIEEIKHTDYYANNIVSDNSTSENNIIPSIINSDYKDEIQFEQISFLSQASRCKHKLIGQVFDTYWLVEFDSSLYIIDQHAAHEKIRYERLIKKYRENKCYSQMISPSIIITLTTVEENTLNAYSEEIKSAGFEIEHFGGNEYAICGVPNELYGISEGAYFNELLDLLSAERTHNDMDSILAYLASASCKGAIKAGNTISFSEASALIDELLKLDNPYNCPHGRPVIVSFSKSELEKKFKRIL